jgi:hypothetical protein
MSGTILDANATSFSELEADLQTANGETTAGTYTIDVSGTIGLTGVLPEIDLAGGVVLDIVGANGAALDGGASEAGFFVYAGNVSIDDLTLEHMLIQGGNGQTGGGGGGAGLGGGLFVGSQAAVTLDKVSFSSDQALGGNGGAGATNATGGHGGITRAGIGTGGRGGSYSGNLNGGSGQFGGGGGGGVGSKPSTLFLSRTTHGAIYVLAIRRDTAALVDLAPVQVLQARQVARRWPAEFATLPDSLRIPGLVSKATAAGVAVALARVAISSCRAAAA